MEWVLSYRQFISKWCLNHSGKRPSQSLRRVSIDSIHRQLLPCGTELLCNGLIRYLMMLTLFHSNAVSRHTISWILVAALLMLTLVPFYYHLHHDDPALSDAPGVPNHVTDIHILGDNDNGHHEGSHILEPTPDVALKQSGVLLPVFAALLILAVLLPLLAGPSVKPAAVSAQRLPRFHRHNTPPLRAPPRD